ncbi:UPF0481 protein At3g47200-like [Pistacia vera]|uniref:UPF0481 protein At3g47200-like n=1 Tax=Pistacia vera TaxID=55513 RepID=UPI0012631E04|nr:UPF0481 protein At3g47200-like [Pistacia vera]
MNEAGIKFTKAYADSILDINFKNGVLEIPPLSTQETTETILRNLISFEQSYPSYLPIVTSYVMFMGNLIDTEKDVEILSEHDIIDNWLYPEDLKQFFKKLYHGAYAGHFFYLDICRQVKRHRNRWWPRWRFMYLNTFTTPWATVSQVVILEFLQTLYSILGVMEDKKS